MHSDLLAEGKPIWTIVRNGQQTHNICFRIYFYDKKIYSWYTLNETARGQRLCVSLVTKLCFYNPMDCSPPGSSDHGISKQEYWSGLPFPFPGNPPDQGIKLVSPALAGRFFAADPPMATWSLIRVSSWSYFIHWPCMAFIVLLSYQTL